MDPTNNATPDMGCIVCYETITTTNKASIKGCSHEFCYICIKNWAQTSLSCPLCKQEFSVLQHSFKEDGACEEEVLSMPTAAPIAVEEQLNCLDHSFFLAEVSRLLQAAEHAHKQLWLEGRVGRGVSIVEKQQLQALESVCVELRNHKRRLQALLQFDPHTVLQDLYRLQAMLENMWRGSYGDISGQQQAAPPVRYSADDAWEGDISDDDDELAEEMAYLAIAKSKQAHKAKGGPSKTVKPTTPIVAAPPSNTHAQKEKVSPQKKNKKRGKQSAVLLRF
jgi:hypothetical protein